MNSQKKLAVLPLLPIRDMVLFVNMESAVSAGRSRSMAAIEAAAATEDKTIIVATQRVSTVMDPQREDLYEIGTRALIRKMERLPNNAVSLVLRGLDRVRIRDVGSTKLYLEAEFEVLPLPADTSDETEALHRDILSQGEKLEELMGREWPRGVLSYMLESLEQPIEHVYSLASLLKIESGKQQEIHQAGSCLAAMRLLHEYMIHEVQVLTLQHEIASQAASNVSEEQRQYMLRRQLEAIRNELGEDGSEQAEIEDLRNLLGQAGLPEEVEKVTSRELDRLQRMSPAAQEYQLTHAYLKLVAELPWRKSSNDKLDLDLARKILDEDHFDLKEVKERIIEHLAMRKLNPASKSAILCLVGGPGVGKTSLGQSIARALGREFERISLGGLHDEAELRGHRRTYIGAMPGRIIQALRRKGVNNPVIMLDEVDKLGRDFRGDPAAALMEILDPSQNADFRDNYLELPFDLSRVFFITTANTLDTIPGPLLDRMEVLRLSGYTEEEKLEIARRYLLPRQLANVALGPEQIALPDAVLKQIIRGYTREAGVRELDRQIGRVVRKCALPFAKGSAAPVAVTAEQLPELLGPARFKGERQREEPAPGIATGLAWTAAGGDVLFVESVLMPGGKGLMLTGQLGDVMKESAQTALSYIWSRAEQLGIDPAAFRDNGVHIHVPAGAIPKDGPSAGVTMASSMVSLFTGRKVRRDTAMTGEITLAGLVLPVGGIKEKVLAARRAGITRIILPEDNATDLEEIDEQLRREIEFIPVSHLDAVFKAGLA